MQVLCEGLFLLLELFFELRLKHGLTIMALIILGLFTLFAYGSLEVTTKQLDQYNEIVATAQYENYDATEKRAMQISSDNKITRLEFSSLKSQYEKDLLYAKRINQKKPT